MHVNTCKYSFSAPETFVSQQTTYLTVHFLSYSSLSMYADVAPPCRGSLIWPSKVLPGAASDSCPKCGSAMRFVFQLMPALMPMLLEAAQWLGHDSEEHTAVPDWDWTTIAVFGCEKFCMKRDVQELAIAIASE